MTQHASGLRARSSTLSRRSLLGAAGAISLAGLAAPVRAADGAYPNRPVRLVVPFPPAGAADIISRLIAEPLGRELGQTVVVENRTGAGGRVGTEAAVRAPADGYTLLMGSQATNSVNPEIYADLPYDPARDLVPVAPIGGVGNVLYVRNTLDITSLQGLIERARANPGGLTYGSAGNGGSLHLAMSLFEIMAGIRLTHVPYRGTAPATADVIANQIDMLCDVITTGVPHITGGKVRALAVTTAQRYPGLPDVPTFAEAGVPGYEAVSYYGLFAPAGTPAPVLATLRAAALKVLGDAPISRRLSEQGLVDLGLTPDQFAGYVARDRQRWGEVIRKAGITAN